MLKVAINGFGRIGRNVLRAYLEYAQEYPQVEIVAVNDVACADILLHLFRYDSTHGRLSRAGIEARLEDGFFVLQKDDKRWRVAVLNTADPAQLPWGDMGVDVALECSGQFRHYRSANLHRQAGAKQVVIGAAPFDDVDACVVMGVNTRDLLPTRPIVSGVSCTTQALAPPLWVLDRHFGLRSAMLTEIHAVTADQTVLDSAHRDWRRARASGHNVVPTTSSSIAAIERVLPELKGKINGHSLRVPTIDVAAIDLSLTFAKKTDVAKIASALKDACAHELFGVMDYSDEPLVSSDFIHNRHSLVVDGGQLMQSGDQFKLFAWYDNEWGYANRLLDMCQRLAQYGR